MVISSKFLQRYKLRELFIGSSVRVNDIPVYTGKEYVADTAYYCFEWFVNLFRVESFEYLYDIQWWYLNWYCLLYFLLFYIYFFYGFMGLYFYKQFKIIYFKEEILVLKLLLCISYICIFFSFIFLTLYFNAYLWLYFF